MDSKKSKQRKTFEEGIGWRAPEFIYYEKTTLWYTTVIIIGLLALFLSLFWLKNILFAIFIILATTLLIWYGAQKPRIVEVKIDPRGISLGNNQFWGFDKLVGFAVYVLHPEISKDYYQLVLHSKSKLSAYIKILAPVTDLHKTRRYLLHYLPELEYTESLIDHLGHVFRF